jgi:hypothetical protein
MSNLIEAHCDFGIHLSQQSPQFRLGFFYRHDVNEMKFNSIGIKLSITPKDIASVFGGLGYSLLTLGNSGNVGNVLGTYAGWQRSCP